ncbi:MAG: glycine betaine ABC transporter substrate-binding protein [Pseudomonadales bacterium]|jgi:osmoprotectant transport system permease protein|nr:glycine betaine ABC transporter substrate-binding protein [Pseudomonadales bacterium]MDP6470922.1 glycine betaine ABC transporter substrate-binding protein [Pseudomonadales bacterium]MDP6825893.1 glycine betaine ABC transporter substrate-binding protein [Pseudomonadales bacterium]MDP6972861.1 glycine betaine ABC transporter substrate-binding protein [Pseudomonadales bacterium]
MCRSVVKKIVWILVALSLAPAWSVAERVVTVGSKNFNESYVLGELVAQVLEGEGYTVERKFGLGGTLICFDALTQGEVDVYVEYSGTLEQAILKLERKVDLEELNRRLDQRGVRLLDPLGFNNTYAMVLKRELAESRGMISIASLAQNADLRVVVSHEFLEREDGWPGLARTYGLDRSVTGIEHGLAYQALDEGALDVTDAYSTDGELERYQLTVLKDDRDFFPRYLAAALVRADADPHLVDALGVLAGTLDDSAMQALNAQVIYAGRTFAEVAAEHLARVGIADPGVRHDDSFWRDLGANTLQHLKLTGIALLAAIAVGVGASLAVFRSPVVSRALVYLCGLLQTIPSIALLALMIPLFGIGALPAVIALFLYSLLPILRNSITALTTVDPSLIRVAGAMGLTETEQLRHLYLPLSMPSILAGVRTAAVISIGTATLAAFIGAGGLGDPIVTGLALNNVSLILQGAVPAALLAVLTELVFELVERATIPKHLLAKGT